VKETYEDEVEGVEHEDDDHCEEHLEKTSIEVPVEVSRELLRTLSDTYELHALSVLHTPHDRHQSPLH
jgi:hypothetical protein